MICLMVQCDALREHCYDGIEEFGCVPHGRETEQGEAADRHPSPASRTELGTPAALEVRAHP